MAAAAADAAAPLTRETLVVPFQQPEGLDLSVCLKLRTVRGARVPSGRCIIVSIGTIASVDSANPAQLVLVIILSSSITIIYPRYIQAGPYHIYTILGLEHLDLSGLSSKRRSRSSVWSTPKLPPIINPYQILPPFVDRSVTFSSHPATTPSSTDAIDLSNSSLRHQDNMPSTSPLPILAAHLPTQLPADLFSGVTYVVNDDVDEAVANEVSIPSFSA